MLTVSNKTSSFFSHLFQVEIVPFSELKPGQDFEVKIRTDADSKVALSAVDSAVYILNKKDKLCPQKVLNDKPKKFSQHKSIHF